MTRVYGLLLIVGVEVTMDSMTKFVIESCS